MAAPAGIYHNRASLLKALSYLDGGGVKEGDMLFEVGSGAFVTTGTTLAVVTALNKIEFGLAVAFDSYSPAATGVDVAYEIFVRPDVTEDTNSHLKTVSLYRSSTGAISALKVCWLFFGKLYDTVANT